MLIEIELSPLVVAAIEERIGGGLQRLDEQFQPTTVQMSVEEWVQALLQPHLDAMVGASRHPDVVAYREQVEASRQAVSASLFSITK